MKSIYILSLVWSLSAGVQFCSARDASDREIYETVNKPAIQELIRRDCMRSLDGTIDYKRCKRHWALKDLVVSAVKPETFIENVKFFLSSREKAERRYMKLFGIESQGLRDYLKNNPEGELAKHLTEYQLACFERSEKLGLLTPWARRPGNA